MRSICIYPTSVSHDTRETFHNTPIKLNQMLFSLIKLVVVKLLPMATLIGGFKVDYICKNISAPN